MYALPAGLRQRCSASTLQNYLITVLAFISLILVSALGIIGGKLLNAVLADK